MGVVQQVADAPVRTLGEGAIFYKMPSSPTSEASLEDPVKVRIGRDQLNPPVEGVAGEFYPRERGEERGTGEELDIVATLETHRKRRVKNNRRARRGEVLYSKSKGWLISMKTRS